MTHRHAERDAVFLNLEVARLAALQIEARIAIARSAFYNHGVALTQMELHAMYDEQRAAAIQVQTLKIESMKAKLEAKALKGKTFVEVLVSRLRAAGSDEVLTEAHTLSHQALQEAGLSTAYAA